MKHSLSPLGNLFGIFIYQRITACSRNFTSCKELWDTFGSTCCTKSNFGPNGQEYFSVVLHCREKLIIAGKVLVNHQ